jgi:hypothetical protein
MAGFWPGVLWQLHALTGKPIWAEKAQLWQKNLANKQREFTTQHDWGKYHAHHQRLEQQHSTRTQCQHPHSCHVNHVACTCKMTC